MTLTQFIPSLKWSISATAILLFSLCLVQCRKDSDIVIITTSRSTVLFEPSATSDTIRVMTTSAWTVSSNQNWLTVTPSSGTGNATITLTVIANTAAPTRDALVDFSVSGGHLAPTVQVSQNGRVVLVAGGFRGLATDQLSSPSSVCVDSDKTIYITDQDNNRVMKWLKNSSEGSMVAGTAIPGTGLHQLSAPYGIFRTPNGDLYIGDNMNARVMKWSPGVAAGTVVAGGNGEGLELNQVTSPCGVAVDAEGNVYVIGQGGIRKWAPGATTGTIIYFGPLTSFGFAITLDKHNNIYVCSGTNCSVVKFPAGSSTGTIVAGGNGRGDALNQMDDPSGVYVDKDGNIFVADQGNDRVTKWTPGATDGVVVAGGNGRGSDLTQLSSPSGLWVDEDSNVYVSDQGNNRIMKWYK